MSPGLHYGLRVHGKHVYRVRESHIVAHLIPLVTSGALGAAKLDVLLRGLALLPEHAGERAVGTVLPSYGWEQLHDLARVRDLGARPGDAEPSAQVLKLKRKWVGAQLARLEKLNLVRRVQRPGQRPSLLVLCDDASGKEFDDPDGDPGQTYLTLLGPVISSGVFARWGAPELCAYLASLYAERHDDAARGFARQTPGTGRWFRPLAWFADSDGVYRSTTRVLLPLNVATLRRGLGSLERQGLISTKRTSINPITQRRFQGPRIIYQNNFSRLDPADLLSDAELRELAGEEQQADPRER